MLANKEAFANEPLVSVIIPIYMVQEYLDQCIESVINQVYRNLEIILVDDGSKDRCPEICDKWAKLDPRVCVIHKEHGGVSSARNVGINIARGEYIAFVDSDDWLHPLCYKKVVNRALATNADIVGYDIFEAYEDKIIKRQHVPNFSQKQFHAKEHLSVLLNMWPLAWAKIYKKDFITKYKLRFVEGILYEDNPFVLGCWIRNPLVSFINEHLHYYRLGRIGQITYGLNPKTLDVFVMLDKVQQDFHAVGADSYLKYLVNWKIQNVIWLYQKTPHNLRCEYFKKMRRLFMSLFSYEIFRPKYVRTRNLLMAVKVILLPRFLFDKSCSS